MKTCFIILGSVLFSITTYSQNKAQTNILDKFIEAHNKETKDALRRFIKDTYHPSVYSKINVKDHVAFYNQIIEEFGPLNFMIYKKIEETPLRYVVHLIKKERHINNQNINPLDILVVKIDLIKTGSIYMPHGLGLGSLVCEQRKE